MGVVEAKLYKDIKLKKGGVIPKGSRVLVKPKNDVACEVFIMEPAPGCTIDCKGKTYVFSYRAVFEPPDMEDLMEQVNDGVVETPTGNMVEPDGHDPEGFPAWSRIFCWL